MTTPKPGWQTTEGILAFVATAFVGANQVPDQYVPWIAVIVSVYGVCRTVLKAVHASGGAKDIPDLPDLPPSFVQNTPVPGTTTTTITTVPK